MTEQDFFTDYLRCRILSTRIDGNEKKYVVYLVELKRHKRRGADENQCVIERRYSEFLELYTKLRQEFPAIFTSFSFPKKAIVGNFSPQIINARSASFERFLMLVAQNEKVLESCSVVDFFNYKEKKETLRLLSLEEYNEAIVLLKHNFQVLNRLFNDRHRKVLEVLCLLIGCCEVAGDSQIREFTRTAVCRFESVSDTDSLRYYVPLLQICVHIMAGSHHGEMLQERLDCMKKRGITVDGLPHLFDIALKDYRLTDSLQCYQ